MIEIKENFRLLPYNTFRIDAKARFFVEIKSEEDISELFLSDIFQSQARIILGGGSNILFTGNFNGLVIHPMFDGIEIIDESAEDIEVRVGSGVVWDEFVSFAVSKNWGGIENLSDIPGNVGASPVQNIGAYGREVKEVVEKVEATSLSNGEKVVFTNRECKFEYRNSIFKSKFKNDLLITSVTFRLSKPPHVLITHYDNIEHELLKSGTRDIDAIRKIITGIRRSKLPLVDKTGNAGSFFRNPILSNSTADKIKAIHPNIPVYRVDDDTVKLSAAWLIDKSGCKGLIRGNAGCYETQPLVLINLGNADGNEILDLANFIRQKVFEEFGVHLQPEVYII
jgi:UDP-N-acetylmuramate dehydrogenase